MAQPSALQPSRSWATSRVTLSDTEFDKLNVAGQKNWQRDTDHMGKLGEGVTICVVDCQGFYCNDFEVRQPDFMYKYQYANDINPG